MAAYFIVDVVEIRDQAIIGEYAQKVVATVEKYGGRYIVRGGPLRVVEGDWQFHLPVVLEFPSFQQAERWYGSEDYRPVKELRLAGARSNVVLVAGIDGSAPKH